MKDVNAIVKDNLNLVIRVAQNFRVRYNYPNVDDLVSAGEEALVIAAQRYDETRGKFAPYANSCIWGAMLNELDNLRPAKKAKVDTESLEDRINDNGEARWDMSFDTTPPAWQTVDDLLRKAQLAAREDYVIRKKYGIDMDKMSTDELAAELGITVQMVNYIKRQAFDKIRCTA